MKRKKEDDRKAAEKLEQDAECAVIAREYASFITEPVPQDIDRSMQAYLAGKFTGADRSPLAYVGYRVGETNGLAPRDRERRMMVCLRIDIPPAMRADYRNWGGPATPERLGSMRRHLTMLASMRRGRLGYKTAVAEWERDAQWLQTEMETRIRRFARYDSLPR